MDKEIFNYVLDQARGLKDFRLSEPFPPAELKNQFTALKLNEEPETSLKELVDGVLKHSINTQNPRFLNQLYGGTSEVTWLGELLVSIFNTSMATYEIAPLATLCEKEIFEAINSELGFESHLGLFVPGGSYANMLGLQCARYKKHPESKEKGLYSVKPQYVFVSKEAHYSTEKAMGLMGLGINNLVKVETDQEKQMCPQNLELKISEVLKSGGEPLCVVSTAGTTVWGSFDPFDKISEICEKNNIWHHVDAAWGGLTLWSKDKDQFFKDVKRVNSITLDFHKLMSSSLTKGIFITNDPQTLKSANAGGGTKYIFHNSSQESYDTGVFALQCGRKVDSIPLWLLWKSIGTKGFREKIGSFLEIRDWLSQEIKNKPGYTLLHEPKFLNFCFQLKSPNTLSDGEFTLAVRDRLMQRGKFMVNYSSDEKNGTFFRLVLNHWGVTKEILNELFVELDEISTELS